MIKILNVGIIQQSNSADIADNRRRIGDKIAELSERVSTGATSR